MSLNIVAIWPEALLLIGLCTALLLGLFIDNKRAQMTFSYWMAQFSVVAAGGGIWLLSSVETPLSAFYGDFVWDHLAFVAKAGLAVTAFAVFLYGRQAVDATIERVREYYVLCLFSLLGLFVMVSASDFLLLFMGLELSALPLYALAAMQKTGRAIEAGIKYFVMGALAASLLLYGISLVYGMTGSVQFSSVIAAATHLSAMQLMLLGVGGVFILAALVLKLGVVPFHLWVPDVYEGVAWPVALFMSTLPKIAGVVILLRISAQALPMLHVDWQPLLFGLAALSIAGGNLMALVQTQLRRLLAYSSIAHMGYLLLGVLVAVSAGYSASLFYLLTYVLVTLVAFGTLCVLSSRGYAVESIADLGGLGRRAPGYALLLLFAMFTLAGIPPFVGFMAKFSVLMVLLHHGHLGLALFALVFSVVAGYYYLTIVRVMYFDQPTALLESTVHKVPWGQRIVLAINGVALLLLGVFPAPLIALCQHIL